MPLIFRELTTADESAFLAGARGGHIGYGVAPAFRGNGYATKLPTSTTAH